MRPLIILAFALVLPFACAAQAPTLRSVLNVEALADSTYGFSLERLITTQSVVLRGAFTESIAVDGVRFTSRGLADGFLLCVDDRLRRQWLRTFGGPGYDAVTCIAPLPDGGLAVGMLCGAGVDGITSYRVGDVTFSGRGGADAVVFVINADGSLRWVRNDGAINAEFPTSIAVLNDTLIVVVGIFVRQSRFGPENVADSAEISGYVQAIDMSGNHRWVRVVRGRGVNGSSTAVQVDVRYVHTASTRIGVVVQSTESLRWGDSTLVVSTGVQQPTTAAVYADAQGNELGISGVVTCVAEQTVFGSRREAITAATAEYATDSCTPIPFDAVAWRADALAFSTQRLPVQTPHVRRTREGVRGTLIAGNAASQPLLLALSADGNERWRYEYGTQNGGSMCDAIEADASVIAVVVSPNIELLRLDLPSGVDGTEVARMSAIANIVYNDELRELRNAEYTLMTLTGSRIEETTASSPFSRPLAPQVCILLHASKPSRVVLYFCR